MKNFKNTLAAAKDLKIAKKMLKEALKREITDEGGASMVEYALIVALIAVVVIAVITLLGSEIKRIFNDILESLQGAKSEA